MEVQYSGLLVPFMLALLLPVAIVWGALRASTQPGAGLAIVMGLATLEALVVAPRPMTLGINIYPADPVFLLIGAIATARLLFGGTRLATWPVLGWLAFGIVSVSLFGVGLVHYGTKAGVEFRQIFYLWCAVAYFVSFPISTPMADKLMRSLAWWMTAFAAIAAFRWIDQLDGWTGIRWGLLVGANPWRVLDSNQTLLLLLVWLWLYIRWARGRLSMPATIAMQMLLALVLVLQHRTVWACGLVAVLALCAIDAGLRRATLVRGGVTLGVLATGLAFAAAMGKLDVPIEAFGRSLSEAFQGRGSTISWRLQSWQELVDAWRAGGPSTWLFGQPYGAGWRRYIVDLQSINYYSPHSFYVHTLLRGGLVALLAVMAVYAAALVRAFALRRAGSPTGEPALLAIGVVTAVAAYSLTYNPGYGAGLVLGVVLGVLRGDSWSATAWPSTVRRAAVSAGGRT